MSSILSAPPSRIPLGGPPAGPGGPQGAPPQESQAGPDPTAVKTSLQAAIKNLRDAQEAEGDDQDAAVISELIAKVHKLVGAHQGLMDQAMGAGAGVKLVRKTQGGGY